MIVWLRHVVGWAISAFPLGIPVKVNGDSSGKPNGVPVKANRRRSEATLAYKRLLHLQPLNLKDAKRVCQLKPAGTV
jgi:hypothetical protein